MIDIIKILLHAVSPQLRELIVNFVKDFSERASKTPNPIDDVFALLFKAILDIKD